MSSASGKSGGAQKSKNYYGTIAGAVCWGPLDWLDAVIHNGGYLFQGPLAITTDVTDLTGSIADPTLIGRGGYLKLYRGTPTQSADAALVGHSPYKDTVYLVGKHLFFGQDSGTAPNLQIIGGRIPRVSTSIVAALDNVADDGQVNPIAALAEFLLDERGAGVPLASFDAASWLAAGHWAYLNRDITFCSPLITEQVSVRDIVKRFLEPIGGLVRWSRAGLLSCIVYEWGIDPGGLPVLDARTWTRTPKFKLGDWVDIPTEYLVSFTDRDYEFQNNAILVPNARAAQIRQVDDQRGLSRPDVTRSRQAHRQATELSRRLGTAPSTASIRCRAPVIASLGLLPGDKVRVDTDPEPGGSGLSQLCRITSIDQDRTDEATVRVVTDNLLPATVYEPTYTLPTLAVDTSPTMANYLAIPLPPAAFGFPPACAILATRPSAAIIGMDIFFSDASANPFDQLGQQTGFAVRGQLSAGISSGATTVSVIEVDGLSAPDADLAADTPGGNTTRAQNNAHLLVLATLDVNGRVELDGSGDPKLEFLSIVDRSFVSGSTFSYTVLRGRLDTAAAAWTTAAAAWIVPLENLVEWRSDLMSSLAGVPAFFRLVSYTKGAEDVAGTVPECSVNMMPITSPMYLRGIASSGVNGTRTAILDVYQWAATIPSTFPVGTSVYTWATGQFVAPGTLNGWAVTPPAPVAGQTLWVLRQIYADILTTATTVVTWAAVDPFAISLSPSSGVVSLLTNEAHTVAADSAGTVPSFAGVVTRMYVYLGLSDDSANWTFSKTDTDCTSALSGTPGSIATVSALSADVGYVDILATRTGYPSQVKRFTIAKSKGGTTGADAKLVVLTSDSQTFQLPKAGGVTPSSINFAASGQNLTGSPVFTVVAGTATLTGAGDARNLVLADMATEAITVRVVWDGQTDYISIVKVREGVDGQRIGFLEVYQWAASAPSLPTGTSTYTWATGAFTAPSTPNGWSLLPGAAVPGQTLWGTSVAISNTNSTPTDVVTWTGGSAYAVGAAGTNGTNGTNAPAADMVDFDGDAGTAHHIIIDKPAGAGSGYHAMVAIGSGAPAATFFFPVTYVMASGSQTLSIVANDTDKSPSAMLTVTWNLLFL